MTIYKIRCEWDMPIAQGYYLTKELAEAAIQAEDWSDVAWWDEGTTKQDMINDLKEDHMLEIEEIEVIKE